MLGSVSVPDGGFVDKMLPVPRHTEPFVSVKTGGLVKFSTGLINMLGNRRWIDDIHFYDPSILHIITDVETPNERGADGEPFDNRREINLGIWKRGEFKRERVGQVHLYKYIWDVPYLLPNHTPDGLVPSDTHTEHKFTGENGLTIDRDNDPDGRVIIQLDTLKGQRNNNKRIPKGNGKKTTTKK